MNGNSVRKAALRQQLMSWPILVVLNLVVAVTGYLKDVTVAAYLGTSPTGDAYTTAYFIVDLVGVLSFSNAIGLAAAAVFGPLVREDPQRLGRFVRNTAWTVVGTAVGLTLVLLLFRSVLLLPFAAHGSSYRTMAALYLLFLPVVIFYPLFSFFAGILQASGRYNFSVGAPALLNLIVTATGMTLMHKQTPVAEGSVLLALSIPVSSALLALLLWGIWVSVSRGRRLTSTNPEVGDEMGRTNAGDPSAVESAATGESSFPVSATSSLRPILRRTFQITLSYGTYLLMLQGLGLIERYIVAFSMPSGALAAMTYASRLGQIPNWVFMSAVATWFIPHLVRAKQFGEHAEFANIIRQGLTLGIYVGVPMTVVFLVLRVPIVTTLFVHGRFNAASARMTAAFLAGYALAMTFQALSAFLFRVSVTTSRIREPIGYAIIGVVLSGVSILLLVPTLGAMAIGLGEAIGGLVTTILLWRSLQKFTLGKISLSTLRGKEFIVSNIAVIAVSILAWYLYFQSIYAQSAIVKFSFLAVSVLTISLVYVALSFDWKTKLKTIREIQRFWRRG